MSIFSVFTLCGGLALFLYGMSLMGTGLEKVSGGKLEKILEKLTSNPLKGVLLGAIVTAVIQSSSATTVMVVGFVNSGIMRLSQAIGIIMGANLGTTVTSWILSLSGIEGESFIVQILKPTSFSPVVAFIGIILFMFSKKGKHKDVGTILIGFAILMFGMQSMSDAVKPLADVPEFANILVMFSNPLLGVITGAILTAIIQSSSASVGILQALSATGSITFASAIPIIMGQNIGTCITAIISSIGATKNAKRAAIVHLYFNVIGTVLFLIIFYSIKAVIGFPFINQPINEMNIAVVHTIFNVISTAVLLPFTKLLEKLAYLTIRDVDKKETLELLDERFLNSPSFALEQCKTIIIKMADAAKDNLMLSVQMIKNYSEQIGEQIIANEDEIDAYEDRLGTYLVKLSSKSLSTVESKEVSKLLHAIGDFERISDHAVNILEVAQEIHEKNITFSTYATTEIQNVISAIIEILNITIQAFKEDNINLAGQVEPLEEVIDLLKDELKTRHIDRLREGLCTIEVGFVFTDLLSNFERVADHCSNIAVCVIQLKDEKFDTHEYLKEIKASNASLYTELYELYKQKYYSPLI